MNAADSRLLVRGQREAEFSLPERGVLGALLVAGLVDVRSQALPYSPPVMVRSGLPSGIRRARLLLERKGERQIADRVRIVVEVVNHYD